MTAKDPAHPVLPLWRSAQQGRGCRWINHQANQCWSGLGVL